MASKLEMYVDILSVLEQRGSLRVSQIMHEANLNCNTLKRCLDFLTNQGLIEEKVVEKSSVVYANTARGAAVVKFFIGLDRTLSVKEEESNIAPVPYRD